MTATALGRPGLWVTVVGFAVAAGAWALTGDRMAGMDAGPGSELGSVGWFTVSWLVMTAAMMLPAVMPMLVAHGRHVMRSGATAAFAAGYLAAWLAAGLVGYAAVEGVRSLEPAFLAWNEAGRYVAAGVVAGAGLYQVTACKDVCLRRCRDHRTFLRERRGTGRVGTLRMGLVHGGFCIGCSWALMAALFALGVMSLTWMALVTVLIATERLLPRPSRLGVAVVLVALGVCVAVAPEHVPALTVPDSGAMHGMRMQ